MFKRFVFFNLLALLAIRKPSHLIYKPAMVFAIILCVDVAVRTVVTGMEPAQILPEMFVIGIVAAPLVAICMAMVTHMEKLQRQMARIAGTDMLTNLPNRRTFMGHVEAAISAGQADVLMIVDADHFKRVNDTFGHAAGDLALVCVAEHLRHVIGPKDKIARLGGEEFGLLIRAQPKASAHLLGAKIAAGVAFHLPEHAADVTLTLSIGATELQPHDTSQNAFERADNALYDAKSAGRARMVYYAPPADAA